MEDACYSPAIDLRATSPQFLIMLRLRAVRIRGWEVRGADGKIPGALHLMQR